MFNQILQMGKEATSLPLNTININGQEVTLNANSGKSVSNEYTLSNIALSGGETTITSGDVAKDFILQKVTLLGTIYRTSGAGDIPFIIIRLRSGAAILAELGLVQLGTAQYIDSITIDFPTPIFIPKAEQHLITYEIRESTGACNSTLSVNFNLVGYYVN